VVNKAIEELLFPIISAVIVRLRIALIVAFRTGFPLSDASKNCRAGNSLG
jgi:hypothetical protein